LEIVEFCIVLASKPDGPGRAIDDDAVDVITKLDGFEAGVKRTSKCSEQRIDRRCMITTSNKTFRRQWNI
jgi:hypothetical protein